MMSNQLKRIVIVGATSAIAEHCARLWVKNSAADLTLVGRDLVKTEQVAADLRVRSPGSVVRALKGDFMDASRIQQLVTEIVLPGPVDCVLIAHGWLPDQTLCQSDLQLCREALEVNGISPVLFAEAFAGAMQKANRGTLAIIGSVAGDRGRKSNYVYGAAKGLVERYAQGLWHRLANTAVKIVLIKPGPTATPMTAHLTQSRSTMANVQDVAESIVQGIERGSQVIYTPAKWSIIMMIVRHLPCFIMKRLNV